MNEHESKCVIIIDEALPTGIIANTSAILGVTLGKAISELVGKNVIDASGKEHLGIINIPLPILKGNKLLLKELRGRLFSPDFCDLTVVDFSDVAQCCNVYSEYVQKAALVKEEDHTYLGIAIFGDKKKVNKLTGSMPLLR